MTVQGLGNGYGYYQAAPTERKVTFRGEPAQAQPQQKKSLIGGLIKLGIIMAGVYAAVRTGTGYKGILKLAKKQGLTSNIDKAKLFGKAFLKHLNPKNWPITKKAMRLFGKGKPAKTAAPKGPKAAKQTVKVAKVETTPEGYKLITDVNGTKILDKGSSYEVIRGDVVKEYATKLRDPGKMKPKSMKEMLALPAHTPSGTAEKSAQQAFQNATGTAPKVTPALKEASTTTTKALVENTPSGLEEKAIKEAFNKATGSASKGAIALAEHSPSAVENAVGSAQGKGAELIRSALKKQNPSSSQGTTETMNELLQTLLRA